MHKTDSINQSINQYIYNAPWYRGACYSADYAGAKRNVLSRVLNVLTDGTRRRQTPTGADDDDDDEK